jgi:hypothetical protein
MYCYARLPQLEGAAVDSHRHTNLLLPRRQGKKLRGEEMGPQIPVGSIPKKPSQTAAKMVACTMELGLRLCSSTL